MIPLSAAHFTPLLISCILLQGCAYTYLDDRGTRHVLGLVNLELPATGQNPAIAGQVVDITTLGLSLGTDNEGSSLSLGYNHEIRGHLRNNALVIGDPLAIDSITTRTGTEK